MGIIWHLSAKPGTFRNLQAYCESISPTVLNNRLKELTTAGLVKRTTDGYCLTKKGKELYQLLKPLGKWAKSWAKSIRA
jgi:DNA-binding HxlR family transcriptional regulator